MPEETRLVPPQDDQVAEVLAQLFGFAILAFAIAAAIPTVRHFLEAHWVWVLSIAGVVLLAVTAYGPVRQIVQRNVRTKVGAIVVALALLSIMEASIGVLPPAYQITALRSVLVFTVCLLPGILYYLFITTRRDSLLNEYLSNLVRLGLLSKQHDETDAACRLRTITYLQKFEAAYGPIDGVLTDIIAAGQPVTVESVLASAARDGRASKTLASIFTPEAAAPLVICTVLIALGWIISLPPWHNVAPPPPLRDQPVEWLKALYPDRSAVYFAFLGAYFFGIQMLFRRYMLKDLRANAYVAVSIRIVLAVVGTWVLIEALRMLEFTWVTIDDARVMVPAFVIGVFPPVVWQFLQAAFKKVTAVGIILPSVDAKLPLNQLDGLTIWHEARLQEEDIENVPNMATASIVDLMLNTRFSPERIIDWVDQAILCVHLAAEHDDDKGTPAEECRTALRAAGIRTASELVAAYRWSLGNPALGGQPAAAAHPTLPTLVQAISTNRNLHLINTWRGLRDIDWEHPLSADSIGLHELSTM